MKEFLNFIKTSKTAFHACDNVCKELDKNGYKRLNEQDNWNLEKGGKYYITRNYSSVFAFTIPNELDNYGFNIAAAHLDSPTFKLKPNFTLDTGKYVKLNTEVYGGPIFMSWIDRPLDIAGRVLVKEDEKIVTKLFSFDKPVCMIPNICIHYNHDLNKGYAFNPQNELLPILTDNKNTDLLSEIANKLKVEKDMILSYDLYLSLLDRGTLVGLDNEFIMAPQIDNLECSFGILKALLNAKDTKKVNLMCLFDNEEIGSRTRQGASSDVLAHLLERITLSLGINRIDYLKALTNSYFVSADNAQGYHPSYAQKYDPTNACYMNEGIVVKNAARGSYSTDAYSLSIFETICKKAEAKFQLNTNRSDVPGGSTLGCLSLEQVSIPSVDIGLAQLAMHSAYETAGSKDLVELVKALQKFYESNIKFVSDVEVKFE